MCRLPKMIILLLKLRMRQLALETNIGNVQIIVLRKNWIRTNLHKFKGKIFYAWEINHRVKIWLRHIECHHSNE